MAPLKGELSAKLTEGFRAECANSTFGGVFCAEKTKPLSLGCAEPAPLSGEPSTQLLRAALSSNAPLPPLRGPPSPLGKVGDALSLRPAHVITSASDCQLKIFCGLQFGIQKSTPVSRGAISQFLAAKAADLAKNLPDRAEIKTHSSSLLVEIVSREDS